MLDFGGLRKHEKTQYALVGLGSAALEFIFESLCIKQNFIFAAVCSSVGQTRRALSAKRAYNQCWRVRVSIPIRDVGFSPLVCDTD